METDTALALFGVSVALFLSIRLILRHYFPPDT